MQHNGLHGRPHRRRRARGGRSPREEKSLRRGLVLSDGDLTPFFTRPISAVLFGIIALVVLLRLPAISRLITGRRA